MSGGRPPKFYRYERIRQGLPTCANEECSYAPDSGRNGKPRKLCRTCAAASPERAGHPKTLGPSEPFLVLFPVPLLGEVRLRAEIARLSVAEWVRRAVAEKLGQTSDSVSGGPST